MHTRHTSDYSPCKSGSSQENAAIVARREMLKTFEGRTVTEGPSRKSWEERMQERTSTFRADADSNYRNRNGNYMKHKKEA